MQRGRDKLFVLCLLSRLTVLLWVTELSIYADRKKKQRERERERERDDNYIKMFLIVLSKRSLFS